MTAVIADKARVLELSKNVPTKSVLITESPCQRKTFKIKKSTTLK